MFQSNLVRLLLTSSIAVSAVHAAIVETGNFRRSNAFKDSASSGSSLYVLDTAVRRFDMSGNAVAPSTNLATSSTAAGVAADPSGNFYELRPSECSGTVIGTAGSGFTVVKRGPSAEQIFQTCIRAEATPLAIAVNDQGQVVVAGTVTDSTLTPTTTLGTGKGPSAFAMKLNIAGSALLYYTIWGFTTEAKGIAFDSAGNTWVTGETGFGFPVTQFARQAAFGGIRDAFLTKLTSSGTIAYSTFLGGSASDSAHAIGADGAGRPVVVGETASPDFPRDAGVNFGGASDGFVTKYDVTGQIIVFSKLLGGLEVERITEVAVVGSGEVWVVGEGALVPDRNGFAAFYNASGVKDAQNVGLTLSGPVKPNVEIAPFGAAVIAPATNEYRIVSLRQQTTADLSAAAQCFTVFGRGRMCGVTVANNGLDNAPGMQLLMPGTTSQIIAFDPQPGTSCTRVTTPSVGLRCTKTDNTALLQVAVQTSASFVLHGTASSQATDPNPDNNSF